MSIDLNDDYLNNNNNENKKIIGCNCKNSGCLKRYCECFTRMKYCDLNCQCKNCFNTLEHEKELAEAIQNANDETDSKKGKKKCKKAKKNKNKKINKEEEKEKENEINKEKNNYCENEDLLNFEKEFQNFKEELTKDTMYVYEINNKIKPCLSENFLNQISII